MAVYNEILVGRFNRALQKMLGIKGGPPVRQIASEIMAVLPMFYGVEHRYLESWDRFAVFANVGAVAGNQSRIRIRNPGGSNVVGVIERVTMWNALVETPFINQLTSAADEATTLSGSVQRLDARGRINSSLQLSQGAPAGNLPGIGIWQNSHIANSGNDAILDDGQDLILLPGDALVMSGGVANQLFNCTIWWRERILEEPERS